MRVPTLRHAPAQAKCAAAVSLATPVGDVETYAQLWALRPWVDDAAVVAITDAAPAAQASEGQQQVQPQQAAQRVHFTGPGVARIQPGA